MIANSLLLFTHPPWPCSISGQSINPIFLFLVNDYRVDSAYRHWGTREEQDIISNGRWYKSNLDLVIKYVFVLALELGRVWCSGNLQHSSPSGETMQGRPRAPRLSLLILSPPALPTLPCWDQSLTSWLIHWTSLRKSVLSKFHYRYSSLLSHGYGRNQYLGSEIADISWSFIFNTRH